MKKKDVKIEPRNDKEQPHGYWENSYEFGKISLKRFLVNGKLSGYQEMKLTYGIHIMFHL